MNEEPDTLIHIVDDDESMRTSLARLLQQAGHAVKCYASAGDFLVAEPDPRPGCMLLDLEMPGPSGLDLQAAMRRRGEDMPIVFMSAYGDIPRTVLAMKGGASDFLVKPIEAQKLLGAIESALAVLASRPVPGQQAEPGEASLTERELVVLRGVLAGRLNKQLADDLDLSQRTIKSCRASVMRKLGASSLAELVRLAAPLLKG